MKVYSYTSVHNFVILKCCYVFLDKQTVFTNKDILSPSLTYNPIENHDFDGYSDESNITVSRPWTSDFALVYNKKSNKVIVISDKLIGLSSQKFK
jgi:hypothetical protein